MYKLSFYFLFLLFLSSYWDEYSLQLTRIEVNGCVEVKLRINNQVAHVGGI